MQVMLRVVGGKHNGREIKLAGPKFIIGRGEGSHLRPSSDLVSRQHCGISIEEGRVIVEDMGSRNGTFVNGEQLDGPHEARSGDTLRVGRLQFELVLDPVRGSKKQKVGSIVEAAARTARSTKQGGVEDNVSDWLSDDDGDDSLSGSRTETIQFSMDETQTFDEEVSEERSSAEIEVDPVVSESDSKEKKKKKKYGKLPPTTKKSSSANSIDAADEALKKFFNRR